MKIERRKFRNTEHLLFITENERERQKIDAFFKHEFKLMSQNRSDSQTLNKFEIELCTDDTFNPYIRVKR